MSPVVSQSSCFSIFNCRELLAFDVNFRCVSASGAGALARLSSVSTSWANLGGTGAIRANDL